MRKITSIVFITLLLVLALWSFFAFVAVWWFVLVLVMWFFTALIASSLIYLNYHVKAYCSNPGVKGNEIALTFDDGPNENTLKVLDERQKKKGKKK